MAAALIPFPVSKHVGSVARVARRMAMLPERDAEAFILRECEIEYCRLIGLGVDPLLVEKEIISFARAIRSQLWHEVLRPGGVA